MTESVIRDRRGQPITVDEYLALHIDLEYIRVGLHSFKATEAQARRGHATMVRAVVSLLEPDAVVVLVWVQSVDPAALSEAICGSTPTLQTTRSRLRLRTGR